SRTMTPAGCGPSQYVLFNSRHRGRDCDIVSRAHLAAYQADQPDERPTAPDPGKASPRRCRQAWATCSDVVTSEMAEIREGRPTTRPARGRTISRSSKPRSDGSGQTMHPATDRIVRHVRDMIFAAPV